MLWAGPLAKLPDRSDLVSGLPKCGHSLQLRKQGPSKYNGIEAARYVLLAEPVQEVAAYSTLAMTVTLVVSRPNFFSLFRVTPALAALIGVLVMSLIGALGLSDLVATVTELWRAYVAVAAIMVMTEVAMRLGVLEWWASHVAARARSVSHLFALVFGLAVVTAATLNNDAAILLLTPLVVGLIHNRYPDRPDLVIPFAFAVFMAAGVAPFVVSNPMNMVVAEFSGIGFNAYAVRMVPVAMVGWLISFILLRWYFRHPLRLPCAETNKTPTKPLRSTGAQRFMVGLLLSVLVCYGVVAYLGGTVWIVAVGGASVAMGLLWRERRTSPISVIYRGVSWETLAFLMAVKTIASGLFNVGLVARLSEFYTDAGIGLIGVTSALPAGAQSASPSAWSMTSPSWASSG
ncbi:MAG: SLC13 family permease [Myxococcota bacterium]